MYADYMSMLGIALEEGESMRIECPACDDAGRGKERSCNLTAAGGGLVWHCFRAGCPAPAGVLGGRRFVRTRETPRKQEFTPYEGEVRQLTTAEEEFLWHQIGWTQKHLKLSRVVFASSEGRYAFPILNPMGLRRGWMLRSYTDEKYKALTRMDSAEPHMSWYRSTAHGSTVVVEDIPSAVRAAVYGNSVALCGTGLGPDYVGELAAHTRRVVLALDADATGHAVDLVRRYALMFDSMRVLPLEKDLKNMTEEELTEVLHGVG